MYYTSAVILLFTALALQVKLKAHVSLFGGEPGVGLNALRYKRYLKKLATKTSHIERQNLTQQRQLPDSAACPAT